MKKAFHSIPLLLFLLTWDFAWAQTEETIPVGVGFGRGAGCTAGRGACTIKSGSTLSTDSGTYNGVIGLNAKGEVFLEFKYADLTSDVRLAQFSTDLFEIEADCPIPTEVLQQLNVQGAVLSLRKGIYPMEKTEQSVRITFE